MKETQRAQLGFRPCAGVVGGLGTAFGHHEVAVARDAELLVQDLAVQALLLPQLVGRPMWLTLTSTQPARRSILLDAGAAAPAAASTFVVAHAAQGDDAERQVGAAEALARPWAPSLAARSSWGDSAVMLRTERRASNFTLPSGRRSVRRRGSGRSL